MRLTGLLIAIAACGNGGTAASSGTQAWQSSKLGVQLEAPGDVKLEETDSNAAIGNGTFKLNLFVVDAYSAATAEAQKAELERESGFVRFTREQVTGATWRFDYELARGKAGTLSRIIAGRPLDCGVYGVPAAVAAAVATACATVRPR